MDKVGVDKRGIIIFVAVISLVIGSALFVVISHRDPLADFYEHRKEMKEVTVTNLDFTVGDVSSGKIIIYVINSGINDVTLSEIRVNNETAPSWEATNSATVTAGGSEIFTVTQSIMADTKYSILLFSTEGYLVGSYTEIA